jgi:cell division transport system permease protein
MLDRLDFLLGEAFVSLRRNIWMTFAAVTTVAMALFLMGGLGYVYLGVRSLAASLPSKFVMMVYMRPDATMKDVSSTAAAIRAVPGVKQAIWISKEEAWAQQRRDLGPALTEGIENPLSHSFRITLHDIKQADLIAAQIRALPKVDPNGVSYMANEQKFLSDALVVTRVLGLGAGGLMLLTSGVLIYNAIRLTVLARQRELRIMQLVGATRSTIVIPLLVEGIVQGALGGVLASLLLWSSQVAVKQWLESFSAFWKIPSFPVSSALLTLAALGAAYGLICSAFAVREQVRA